LSIRRLKLRSNLTPYLRWHLVNEILDARHFQRLIDLGATIGALAHLTASRGAGQTNHESGKSNRFHLRILPSASKRAGTNLLYLEELFQFG
jgi:hypothetical protein